MHGFFVVRIVKDITKKEAPQKGSPVKPVRASFELVSVVGVEPFDTINPSNEVWS